MPSQCESSLSRESGRQSDLDLSLVEWIFQVATSAVQ